MKYILAHDLGTSGNKATLFSEEGKMVASITVGYSTYYEVGNRAEQDPEDWWQAVAATTREMVGRVGAENIVSVALSGQMMGCLCVDKYGRPLRRHILYCDQRSVEEEVWMRERIDLSRFYAITGHRLNAVYTLTKLMWVRKHEPDVFAATYKVLNAKDYINFKLCGVMATDPSDASGTNAYDLNRWEWSDEILELAQLDKSLFPEVHRSVDIIGQITDEAAQITGLKVGTAVVCGGGDGSCAGVGVGCVTPGNAYNYLGSSSWVALTVEKPIVDMKQRTMNWAHVVPGMLHPSGSMQAAGAAFNWAVSQLCRHEQRLAKEAGGTTFDFVNAAVETSPVGANGLLFLPYMMGERSPRWNADAKGALIGLNLAHTHADVMRAVMEGITLNLGYIVNIFRNHVPIEEMTVIGGGAKSPVWRQMMADIYQTDILIPNYLEEATSIGAAILGGIGVGLFRDFSVTERFIHTVGVVHPDERNRKRYQEWMQVFDRAYWALEDLYAEMAKFNNQMNR